MMKPKYSTGYFTPQANRVKKNTELRLSESQGNLTGTMDINDSLFENLMSCPIKRKLVLNLIASEKDNIEKYKKNEKKKKKYNESPLSKVQRKHLCESPTALLRRRALEQQERQSPLSEIQSEDSKSRSSSRQSSAFSDPSVPFNKLLEEVVAYVEIKSKDEKDRSQGAKALLQSMGAVVRDKFTKDVTHVIFKDGSFATYQKAKLMKAHLVSVLWIEAVRSAKTKISEKKFPALGTEAYDHNVSSLCSQMQRDYEEIIKDELHRSLASGTPLPSTQSLIGRRRTIMTPMPSTSRFCSQEFESSQDREVDQIMHLGRKTYAFDKAGAGTPPLLRSSPEMTDDDSDLTPFINGSIIKREKSLVIPISEQEQVVINLVDDLASYNSTSSMELTNTDSSNSPIKAARNSKKHKVCGSNMDLTTLNGRLIIDESFNGSTKENDMPNTSENSVYHKKTPKLKSKRSLGTNLMPKRSSDDLFNIPDESIYKRRTRHLKSTTDISSDKSLKISHEIPSKDKSDHSSHSAMSTLQLSHHVGVEILSKNTCTTNTDPLQMQREDLVASSVLVSTEKPGSNTDKSTSTNMSSLHISSDSNRGKGNIDNKAEDKSSSTNMSTLHISSDSNKGKENIANKVAEKSSSTDMSSLLISSHCIKDKPSSSAQENQTESNNNFVNIDDKSHSKKKTSLKKVKLNKSHNLNSSANNYFSPLNPNIIKDIFIALEESPLPDQNVTKRRGKYSANSSIAHIPGSSIILPGDNTTSSGKSRKSREVLRETSPSKKLKTVSKSEEVTAKTPRKKETDLDVPGSKNILPDDITTGSGKSRKTRKVYREEASPLKKLKTTLKPEEVSTPRKKEPGLENPGSNTRKSRGRGQPSKKESQPDSKSKKTNEGKSRNKTPSSDSQNASESSGSDKKGKKVRKLYNPDDSIQDVINSDKQEREDKRTKVKKLNSDKGLILNPNVVCVTSNILLTAKAKEFVDKNKIDVQSVLNKESEDSEQDMPSAKTKKKHQGKKISVNSDADEQHELAEEFINKKKNDKSAKKFEIGSEGKIVRRRQSVRLSQRPKKKVNLDGSISSSDEKIPKIRKSVRLSQHPRRKLNLNSSASSSDGTTLIPITPIVNRRSTMEFQTLSQMNAKKRLKIDKNKRPSIVCTKMHKDQIQVFNQIVRRLGGFCIEDEVSTKTTHLVAGEPKRTINMLRAIAMGCWILKHEWLLSSLEEGRWLPEEDYEETDFSPAVQQCRLQRQAFGPSYSMDIFQQCEPIYIARGSIPRCSDLRELVSLCKGKIVTSTRNAGIVVGELVRHEGVKCVKETWILDSITFNKKMPLKKYIIPPNDTSTIV